MENSHSHTQSGTHIHSLSLTHSLTNLPRSRTEWRTHSLYFHPKIRGHTHSNSLSHPDWRARSLTPSLSFSHSLTHLLLLTLTHSHTISYINSLSLSTHSLTHSRGQTLLTHLPPIRTRHGWRKHSLTHSLTHFPLSHTHSPPLSHVHSHSFVRS